jgi:hypothetical protein
MQAIVVKYLGPSNSRGSRYKAIASAGSVTLQADDRLSLEENKNAAAIALCKKLDWLPPYYPLLYSGGLPNGDEVYVLAHEQCKVETT